MKQKNLLFRTVALLLVLLLLAGCGGVDPDPGKESPQPSVQESEAPAGPDSSQPLPETTPNEYAGIEAMIDQMTLREKIGQLFILRPEDLERTGGPLYKDTTQLTQAMETALQEYPVGGLAMFKINIVSEEQIAAFNEALQGTSSIPLFIAVDEEGGLVARLANHSAFNLPKYASAAAVGQSGDPADALAMGSAIGAYLQAYGFNMNFAPVADVYTNPANTVIGNRAFSSNAETAALMANAAAEGLKEHGIIPTFKHFPGHGDTAEDSHSGMAVSYKTKEEMLACEWLPYETLTDRDCVMVGHIAAPEITGDLTPASLSPQLVNGILRQELGFEGVVITDSLIMGAIANEYTSGEAAVKAIEAGCDILLDPTDFPEAFDALLAAVENGTLREERIDESLLRILILKKSYGLLDQIP